MIEEPAAQAGLYLEDSYLLGFAVNGRRFQVRCLFALTRDHEKYAPPLAGEQHCYREGRMVLADVQDVKCAAGNPFVSRDPEGSMDLGSIAVRQDCGVYHISTDWFDMTCRSAFWRFCLIKPRCPPVARATGCIGIGFEKKTYEPCHNDYTDRAV